MSSVNVPHLLYRLRKVWQRRQCSVKGGILTISHATVSTSPVLTHTQIQTPWPPKVTVLIKGRTSRGEVGWAFSIWRLAEWNCLKWVVMATDNPCLPPLLFLHLPPRPAAPVWLISEWVWVLLYMLACLYLCLHSCPATAKCFLDNL